MGGAEGKTLAVYLIYYLKYLIKYLVRAIKKTKIVKIHVRFVKKVKVHALDRSGPRQNYYNQVISKFGQGCDSP